MFAQTSIFNKIAIQKFGACICYDDNRSEAAKPWLCNRNVKAIPHSCSCTG